jgi:hypothetical protein
VDKEIVRAWLTHITVRNGFSLNFQRLELTIKAVIDSIPPDQRLDFSIKAMRFGREIESWYFFAAAARAYRDIVLILPPNQLRAVARHVCLAFDRGEMTGFWKVRHRVVEAALPWAGDMLANPECRKIIDGEPLRALEREWQGRQRG